MTDYDAWLEKPYQDEYAAQERMEEAEEKFLDSDEFKEAYDEWADGDPTSTKEIFMGTAIYENMLERYAENMYERDDYPEDYDY